MAARTYSSTCIIGKSLGTLGMYLLLNAEEVPGARLVWLTPLLERPELRKRILERARDWLVVIGTLDPHFRPEWVEELHAGVNVLILENAHHRLTVQGDMVTSLAYLHEVMQAIREFVA